MTNTTLRTASSSPWLPIATAPKDGTWFLTCRAGESHEQFVYEVGCYDPYMTPEYVEAEGGLYRKEMRSSYDWTGFNNFHRATHWMPLPPPPEAVGDRESDATPQTVA